MFNYEYFVWKPMWNPSYNIVATSRTKLTMFSINVRFHIQQVESNVTNVTCSIAFTQKK